MPAVGPYDFTVPAQMPGDALAKGLAVGNGIRQMGVDAQVDDFKLRQLGLAEQEQQRAAALARQQAADVNALTQMQNPSARDYANLTLKYPQLKDAFKQGWDALNVEQQNAKIAHAAPVYSALSAGRVDLADELMGQQIDALKNGGGDPKDIQAAEAWRKVIKENPKFARDTAGIMLSSTLGADKFTGMFAKAGEERRADDAAPINNSVKAIEGAKVAAEAREVAANADANRRNLESQITERGGRLNLDRDRLISETQVKVRELEQKGGKLEPDARKIVNDSSAEAVMSRNMAEQARNLADQFSKLDPSIFGNGAARISREKFKEFTGSEDYLTQLRNEYAKIRATAVRAGLPQGPASDKDVKFAQQGFLPENANPKEIASFLRGMAGMQDWSAKYEDAKAEWVAAVGHAGKATKDIEVGGVKVPAGYSLSDFVKVALGSKPVGVEAPAPGANTGYMEKHGAPQVKG